MAGTRRARSRPGVVATPTRTGRTLPSPTVIPAAAAARSNTGACSASRRQTATPSRRTSPSCRLGGPSTTASIPNVRNARGESGRPSTRSERAGLAIAAAGPLPAAGRPGLGAAVEDEPQPVQGQPGVVVLDCLAGVEHRIGQPAGGHHGGVAAELGHGAPDQSVDLAGEPEHDAGLQALDRVLAHHPPGYGQPYRPEQSGVVGQGP